MCAISERISIAFMEEKKHSHHLVDGRDDERNPTRTFGTRIGWTHRLAKPNRHPFSIWFVSEFPFPPSIETA
jgi:hypothetical protein